MTLKPLVTRAACAVLGSEAKAHRIPLGPLRGRRLCVSPRISMRMILGVDEPWLADIIERELRPGMVAYDIGAHVGYTALLMGQAVAPGGRVYAWELHPAPAALLRRTLDENPDLPVTPYVWGLGASRQDIMLPVNGTAQASLSVRGGGQLCRIDALDAFVDREHLPPPDFVKIDVERAELECLRGAAETLARYHPTLVVEFGRRQLADGLALLRSYGYRIIEQDGQTRPVNILCRA